jgi:hypothetical protein
MSFGGFQFESSSIPLGQKGVPNGVATLDSGGKVPLSQIPDSLIGGLNFQGFWNASTNSPTLTSGVGTKGHFYIVSVAGNTNLDGISDWNIGDWAVFGTSTWGKVDNSEPVTSVNGKIGDVVLTTTDVAEGTNLYYTDTRARNALSAGTGIDYNSSTGVISINPAAAVTSVNTFTGDVVLTTTNIAEGTNLYYTDARSRNALSAGTGIDYNSSTGVISVNPAAAVTSVNTLTGDVVLTTTNISEGVNEYFTIARARNSLAQGVAINYDSVNGLISVRFNTSNLRITGINELDTIQDIDQTAVPVFSGLTMLSTDISPVQTFKLFNTNVAAVHFSVVEQLRASADYLSLESIGNAQVVIDSNNNDTNSIFRIVANSRQVGFGGGFKPLLTLNQDATMNILSTSFLSQILNGANDSGTWQVIGNSSTDGMGNDGKPFQIISTGIANGEGSGKLIFFRGSSLTTTAGSILTMVHSNSNVGIGTVNPADKLTVNGNASLLGAASLKINGLQILTARQPAIPDPPFITINSNRQAILSILSMLRIHGEIFP